MVQKGRETAELESKGNKRQKGESPAQERNASTKRQSRIPDQTSPTPRKRVRAGSIPESPSTEIIDVNQDEVVAAPEINIVIIREHEIEKRLELIKQLTDQRENELKELAYLEAGNNLMDYADGFLKANKTIQTAKEEPTENVVVVGETPKKGPGRPPSSQSRRKSQSLVAQSPTSQVGSESLRSPSPVAPPSSAPQTPVQSSQPTPQTPTQPAEQPTPGMQFSLFLLFSLFIFLFIHASFFIFFKHYFLYFIFIFCIKTIIFLF